MSNLPKEKRDKIMMIACGTVVLIAIIWFFVINKQDDAIIATQDQILRVTGDISSARKKIDSGPRLLAQIADLSKELSEIESKMIPAQEITLTRWMIESLERFRSNGHTNVALTGVRHDAVSALAATAKGEGLRFVMLPRMSPYNGVRYRVNVEAHYHDFGKFLQDFENAFPYMCVQNLKITPFATPSGVPGAPTNPPESAMKGQPDHEKLWVEMLVVVLYRVLQPSS